LRGGEGEANSDYSDKEVSSYFDLALEELKKISEAEVEENFFAFKRSFNTETFLKEMSEYSDYFLNDKKLSDADWALVNKLYTELANQLERSPQVLCHRDFHAWNLMIDSEKNLRVIDFQDALMGPRAYDLASLLNDRGMSETLGKSEVDRLVERYRSLMSWDKSFRGEYCRCLLQRDLKVVGRFRKFAQEQGVTRYLKWVEGTNQRILLNLEEITSEDGEGLQSYRDFRELLKGLI